MARKTGDWRKVAAILNGIGPRFQAARKVGLERLGLQAEGDLKRGMRSGAPGGKAYPANHPFTVAKKGSSKPMIHHGDLWNAITHKVLDDMHVGIGVMSSASGKDGVGLVNLALIHEFGIYIPVTPKMRGYLGHQGLHLKQSTRFIRIPARPTFGPTVEKYGKEWATLFVDTVMGKLFGDGGGGEGR